MLLSACQAYLQRFLYVSLQHRATCIFLEQAIGELHFVDTLQDITARYVQLGCSKVAVRQGDGQSNVRGLLAVWVLSQPGITPGQHRLQVASLLQKDESTCTGPASTSKVPYLGT